MSLPCLEKLIITAMSSNPNINSLAFAVGPSDISTASEYSESISSYGTNESGGNNNELLNFSSVDYLYDTLNNSINSNNGILDKALVIQAQT